MHEASLQSRFGRVIGIGTHQFGDEGHLLSVDTPHTSHDTEYYSRKCLARRRVIVLGLQPTQRWTPVGCEVNGLWTITGVAMLLPLPLSHHIAFPSREQVHDVPGTIPEGGPRATYRRGQ